MIINKSNIALAVQGFRALFNNALNGTVPNDTGRKLSMVVPSSNATETWAWLEHLAGMKELLGEVKIENIAADSYTIANKEWELTVQIPQADFERDSYGKYRNLISGMPAKSRSHDSQMVAKLLCGGFDNTCYDGKKFFATDHAYKNNDKITFSNKLTKKLSATQFETARKMIKTVRRADGESMELGADLYLIVSAKNESLAKSIVEAERNADGSTNVNKGTAKIIVWSAIDVLGEDMWFLADLGQVTIMPFVIQEEKSVELIEVTDLEDSRVVTTHQFLFQAYKRTGYGYGFPQLVVGSTGAQA